MSRKSDIIVPMTKFQVKSATDMSFSCYTNVKGNIDHALDRVVDGAYQKSIDKHMRNGTMPKMFWNHDSWLPPVGAWTKMEEDEYGLYKEGYLLDTDRGREIYAGMKATPVPAIDSFSIGYRVENEKWNSGGWNDLIEVDIKESSPVNFACNELATLRDVKQRLHDGGLLSKADLRHLLQAGEFGLSKREIERITHHYNPENKTLLSDEFLGEIGEILAKAPFCK